MTFLYYALMVLVLLSCLGFAIGLIKPSIFGNFTRKEIFISYTIGIIVLSVLTNFVYERTPFRISQKEAIAEANELIIKGKYQEAMEKAKEAKSYEDNEDSQEIIRKVQSVLNSQQNFNMGNDLIGSKEYIEAYNSFEKVIKLDILHFDKAQDKLKELKPTVLKLYKYNLYSALENEDFGKMDEISTKAMKIDSSDSGIVEAKIISQLYQIAYLQGSMAEWETIKNEMSFVEEPSDIRKLNEESKKIIQEIGNSMKTLVDELQKNDNVIDVTDHLKKFEIFNEKANEYYKKYNEVDEEYQSLESMTSELNSMNSSFDNKGFLEKVVDNHIAKSAIEAYEKSDSDGELLLRMGGVVLKDEIAGIFIETADEKVQNLQSNIESQYELFTKKMNERNELYEELVNAFDELKEFVISTDLKNKYLSVHADYLNIEESESITSTGLQKESLTDSKLETNKEDEEKVEISKKEEYFSKLASIEASLVELEHLYANGITSEMKEAESVTYERWDKILNEIYGVLKTQLSTDEMDLLKQEQRQWIKDRDNTAKLESSEFEGGSMESLQYISTQARITKERCYELVNVYMK